MAFKKIIITSIGIIAVLIAGTSYLLLDSPQVTTQKAVIIDSLYDDVPNKYFHDQAKKYLEDAGYEVDIYVTENATVNLFKKLPSMNYQFIVMRTHALEAETEGSPIMIFTGEKYSEEKYISEQLFGQLQRGTPLLDRTYSINEDESTGWVQIDENTRMISSPAHFGEEKDEYFVVSPQMITDGMEGRFPNSTILLGGCSTLKNPSMAESFVKKGASEVIGWDDFVSSSDNDRALLELLEKTLGENMTAHQALDEVMSDWKSNPKYESKMHYFST